MLASELISRSLRLINVPGRGSTLSGTDLQQGFEALQDLVNSKAVGRAFVPGIRTHFFALEAGRSVFSYGPGAQLDTDDFSDPAPIRVEQAYVRDGAVITSNQQVSEPRFVTATPWVLGTGWLIANGEASISPGNAGETLSQVLGLAAGITYVVTVDIEQLGGSVLIEVLQDAVAILSQSLAGSGSYEFEVGFAGVASEVRFTADAAADVAISRVSMVEYGKDLKELGPGTDTPIEVIDQTRHNRRRTKGVSGRPYELLFSRAFPNVELRFDHAAEAGNVLVMDVACNRAAVAALSSTLRLHESEIRWLKYALADELSGEYGKSLKPRQLANMKDAWNAVAAGGKRKNMLRVDVALLNRGGRSFNIHGDDY